MTDDSCGCESVCTLPPEELRARVASLRTELLPLVRRRQQLSDGIAWEFDSGSAMRARLDAFVEFERQCCGGVTFEIAELSDAARLRLSVRGPDAAAFEALGGPRDAAAQGATPGRGVAQAATAGVVGVVASLLLCCGLPLAVASVLGVAVAAPLARFDNPWVILLGAIAIAVPSWMVMRRRSATAAGDCEGC